MRPTFRLITTIVLAPLAVLSSAAGLLAHEFWISPERYQIAPGDQIISDIRVGQDFRGGALAFLPRQIERFEVILNGETLPVTSRIGDRPALSQAFPGEGLAVIVHETTDSTLTYGTFEKFENFVTHKDAAWTLEEHVKRGLPTENFKENYRRFAKSLVAVGHGEGRDGAIGLRTEIVAIANPFTQTQKILDIGMPVRILFESEPKGDAQIEVFEKAPDDSVTIATYRTDPDGLAVFPVKPDHEYLVDSVSLIPAGNDVQAGPVWTSLWAALTFKMPDQ